jgi:hypothetical protein
LQKDKQNWRHLLCHSCPTPQWCSSPVLPTALLKIVLYGRYKIVSAHRSVCSPLGALEYLGETGHNWQVWSRLELQFAALGRWKAGPSERDTRLADGCLDEWNAAALVESRQVCLLEFAGDSGSRRPSHFELRHVGSADGGSSGVICLGRQRQQFLAGGHGVNTVL